MESLRIVPSDKLLDKQQVGQGAYGTVYRSRHIDWGQVALKEVVANHLAPKQVKKLKEEAARLGQLRHQNIVLLLGFVDEPQCCALVLEFCKHGSFFDLLNKYDVDINLKTQLLYEVVLGMNYLHTHTPPFIHRDLKAVNVLIGDGFSAKLADFGLSQWKTEVSRLSRNIPRGTVTHIPPEKWRDINLHMTDKCDVYSFAILIWEVLMETNPFSDADEVQIKVSVMDGQRPSLAELPAGTPPVLHHIMTQCWSQIPDDRPAIAEVKTELEEEFINSEIFTNAVNKDKAQLMRQISDEVHNGNGEVPTNFNLTNVNLEAAVEHLSIDGGGENGSPITSPNSNPREPQEGGSPTYHLARSPPGLVSTQAGECCLQGNQIQHPTSQQSTGPLSSRSMSLNDAIPTIVPREQSALNQDVVTDSVPFQQPDPAKKPSVTMEPSDKRRMSAPVVTKEVGSVPVKGGVQYEKIKKKKPPVFGPTIIQKGKAGETIVYSSKVEGLQIGDRNVMYIGSQGGTTARGHFKPNPRTVSDHKKAIVKGTLKFEKTPIDEESMQLLSEHMGKDWRNLGRKLGFSDGQLDSVNSDFHTDGHKEIVYQMLRQWKSRQGRGATIYVIGNALIDIGRPGTASMLSKHSATTKCSDTKM